MLFLMGVVLLAGSGAGAIAGADRARRTSCNGRPSPAVPWGIGASEASAATSDRTLAYLVQMPVLTGINARHNAGWVGAKLPEGIS